MAAGELDLHLTASLPCRKLDREEKAKQQAYSRGVAKAQSMATALRTIGKFTITKRAGDGGKIFGRCARAAFTRSHHVQPAAASCMCAA